MLQIIRDRLTGGFAIAILALIGVPFMFFGINSDFIGQGYAAKVDGRDISINAFENAYRNELGRYAEQGIDLPADIRLRVREGVLNSMIRQALLENYVAEQGFQINNVLVTDAIQRDPTFQVDGIFSKDTYFQWLELRSMDPSDFERRQRDGLRLSQLQRGVGASAFVTPSEYRRYLNLYGETRQVTYAEIDVTGLSDAVEVSDEDVTSYYDARPDSYMSLEQADILYIEIRRNELGERAEITEEELTAFYEESKSRYAQDERRQARHILIPFEDDEAQAEEQAIALAARVRAGEPFEDLARQYSKDGGTAELGGDLSMLLQTQLPGALGNAIFSMEEGAIEGPVKSNFGFHIVRLDAIETGGSLPLAQVRAQLMDELRSTKSTKIFDELTDSLQDALFDGDDISVMAEAVGLELKNATEMTRTGGEPFGSNQAMIDAIFDSVSLIDREVSDIIELDANRSVVFQVSNYAEETRKPIDEVTADIVAAIRSERAATIAREQATQLEVASLAGATLADAAADTANVAVSDAIISRQDTAIDPALGAAIFRAKKPGPGVPTVGTVVMRSGNVAVFSFTAYAPGRPEAIPLADRDAGKLRLGAQSGTADYAALLADLEQNADIQKSADILAQQSLFE